MPITINGDDGISGVDGSAATPALQGTDTNTGISFGTDEVNIVTDGSTRATVDSNGRLLVGTSTSVANLYRANTASIAPTIQLENVTNSYSTGFSSLNYSASGFAPVVTLGLSKSNTQGTNTVVASNDELGYLQFVGADGTNFRTAAWIKGEVDGTPGTDDMPGRLVFSTTADGASSPTERMRIGHTGAIQAFTTNNSHSFRSNRTSSTEQILLVRNNATSVSDGTTVFQIMADGDAENTNNRYTGISDIKLKENVVEAASQWDDIKAIQVRNYNFKEETGYGTHTQIGVIAQELELVSPGLVKETPDRDEDGNDLGTTTKSVAYSVLYMKAVKALQEAMTRIEQLETRVAQLEGGAS